MSDFHCKSPFPAGVTVNWLEPKILLSNHLENGGGEHGFGVEEGREQDFLTEPQGEPQHDQLDRVRNWSAP